MAWLGEIDTTTVAHDWSINTMAGKIGLIEYRNVPHEEGLNHIVIYLGGHGDVDLRYPTYLPLWLLFLIVIAVLCLAASRTTITTAFRRLVGRTRALQ